MTHLLLANSKKPVGERVKTSFPSKIAFSAVLCSCFNEEIISSSDISDESSIYVTSLTATTVVFKHSFLTASYLNHTMLVVVSHRTLIGPNQPQAHTFIG